MPVKALPVKPAEIVGLVIRYRWFMIVPFCLSMMVGIYFTLTLPKIYSAGTTILVQAQKVPSNIVKSLVSVDIDDRISTIKQQILSRSNLEKIIEEYKLFSEPEHAKMYAEDKIDNLRKRISVTVSKSRSGADAFSILFQDKNPQRVMRVANSLASYFIDENLKVREAQAIGTSDFLDDQLNTMRKRLESGEEALKGYRKQYMGALPEQLQTNLQVLDRLQVQLEAKQQNLIERKNMLVALEKQISESQNIPVDTSKIAGGNQAGSQTQASPTLEQLKKQLESLNARYTDRHPDIIRLKRTIASLEAEKNKETASEKTPAQGPENETEPSDYLALQKKQRNEIKKEIEKQQNEISKLLGQINSYQQRAEDTPKHEQELLSVKRDYENIKEIYASLLNRKLEAEISVSMEKKQKGEQFRILDFAKLPQKPISPDTRKIFALSLAAGLGIGGGLVFLLFYFDSSFRKPEDIESVLGISVLATVPAVYRPKDLKRQKLHLMLSLFSLVVSLALLTGFVVLTLKNVH